MSIEKIGNTIISEIVEAIIFIASIALISTFPEVPGKSDIIRALISGWVLVGIATPIIIYLELHHEILKFFRGGLKY